MADFPALQPSARAFTPAAYNVAAFRSYSGSETRVRRGALGYGHTLSLSFAALTPGDAKSIRDHYITQQSSFASFDLPALVWTGLSGYTSLLESGYRWVYASAPTVSDVNCDRQSVQVSLRAVYDYASTGYTPAPYTGTLTPNDPTDWWDRSVAGACEMVPEEQPATGILIEVREGESGPYVYYEPANWTLTESTGMTFSVGPFGDYAMDFADATTKLSIDAPLDQDYVPIPIDLGAGDFTMEGFVKAPASNAQTRHETVLGLIGETTWAELWYLGINTGEPDYAGAWVYKQDRTGDAYWQDMTAKPRGQWNHFALVRDADGVRFYVNGVKHGPPNLYDGFDGQFPLSFIQGDIMVSGRSVGGVWKTGYAVSQVRLIPQCIYKGDTITVPTARL